jgi:hypothetical protein
MMKVRLRLLRLLLAALVWLAGTLQPASAAELPPRLLAAPWHGSYVCNQGLTRLQLTLRPLPGGGGRMEAEFVFAPDPDNPTVPTGSFRLTGSLDPQSGRLILKQDRWLSQPSDPSYRMVDLDGMLLLSDGQALIRGQVTTYGCQDFAVWQFFSEVGVSR